MQSNPLHWVEKLYNHVNGCRKKIWQNLTQICMILKTHGKLEIAESLFEQIKYPHTKTKCYIQW